MNFDSEVKKYIKQLSRAIPHGLSDRKRLLTDIEKNLHRHIQENPSASWEEIIEEFGTADEVAESLIRVSSKSDVLTAVQGRKQRYRILWLLCGVFVVICTGIVFL